MDYLVLGAGISGLGACSLLNKQGNSVILYDKDKKKLNDLKESGLIDKSIVLCTKISQNAMHSTMRIVFSPGIKISNKFAKIIKQSNIRICGELELGAQFCSGITIAITGTNGKTTTTELTNHVLNAANLKSFSAGNNGISVCSIVENNPDYLVCEVSSFQLENAKAFHPHIACFLNFAPDHLDRYKDAKEYLDAKLHIFDNLEKNDFAVFNYDDIIVKNCCPCTRAKKIFVSANQKLNGLDNAAWRENDLLFVKLAKSIYKISCTDSVLKGEHNVYNMLFAFVVSVLCGVDEKTVERAFSTFTIPKHRCEKIAVKDGITYVDDSKATNVHACLNGVNSFKQNIVLLLGGSGKKEDYSSLFSNLTQNVKVVVTFGQMGKNLYKIAKKQGFSSVFCEKELSLAFQKAKSMAHFGDVVLLSPACASFDSFKNFEERGNYFKYLVTGERVEN